MIVKAKKVKPARTTVELTLAELQVISHALSIMYMASCEMAGLFSLHAIHGEDDKTASRKICKAIKKLSIE